MPVLAVGMQLEQSLIKESYQFPTHLDNKMGMGMPDYLKVETQSSLS